MKRHKGINNTCVFMINKIIIIRVQLRCFKNRNRKRILAKIINEYWFYDKMQFNPQKNKQKLAIKNWYHRILKFIKEKSWLLELYWSNLTDTMKKSEQNEHITITIQTYIDILNTRTIYLTAKSYAFEISYCTSDRVKQKIKHKSKNKWIARTI